MAVVLLGLVATAVMSAVGFVLGSEGRSRKILAATEIANRLILQHLDDPKQMPDRSKPIEYGEYRFAWEESLNSVSMDLSSSGRRSAPSGSNAHLSRFRLVTINISEAEDSGHGGIIKGEPLATLSRIYDPTAARNPDALDRFGKDPDRVRGLLSVVTGDESALSPGSSNASLTGRRDSNRKQSKGSRSSRSDQ